MNLNTLSALGALGPHAAWDMAGRLWFNTYEAAMTYARVRACVHRARQRITYRPGPLPGYGWHVSNVPEAPVRTEAELVLEPAVLATGANDPTTYADDGIDAADLVIGEVCS